MTNPLLNQSGLPDFTHILPSHVEPAIDQLLADNRKNISQLLETIDEPTWSNFIEPLDEWDDALSRAWSPVTHMNAVVNSEELREAYNACLPKLSEYATEMGQNETLYNVYKRLAESKQELSEPQRKVLDNALRDFHLSGIDLPPDKKDRFKEVTQQLSELTSQFSDNLLDSTNAWSKHFDSQDALVGLPESALDLCAQIARERDLEGWMLTLDYPSFFPVMTYADDRNLRLEMYEAYNTRASDQGPHDSKFDNSELMEQILALRHEQAVLLGYSNYAERSLATKMAGSTQEVMDFLNDLARRSKPQAERELEELRDFAASLGQHDLQPWDVGYYAEKLRQQRYSISQEELKPYFPETRVIPGMFEVMSRVFNISFHEVEGVESWHPDVKFFEVLNPEGQEVAQFYFDLYARQNKRGGAWMGTCQSRLVNNNRCQLPVAYMTCNFTPPIGNKPSLFTHTEVETLFHEFGHGLHHMLTRVDHPAIAGINGVAWDAVELPSQFMENFCWQKEALSLFSGHYETGAPIPDETFERMLSAKNFQSAMMMARQLEFALFDFRIHLEYDPAKGGRIYEILDDVRDQVSVLKVPSWNRFAHSFSHIFAGGYAAGYYSYKWAEVLSADAFSLFEEKGIFNQEAGQSFLNNILAMGGSRDAAELFRAFRGRDPEIDALLRHTGIAA